MNNRLSFIISMELQKSEWMDGGFSIKRRGTQFVPCDTRQQNVLVELRCTVMCSNSWQWAVCTLIDFIILNLFWKVPSLKCFLSLIPSVIFPTGVLSRSLSSSSSSLDSRHGPGARPHPLPRQRLPARQRKERVALSPRTTPSPALRSYSGTTVLAASGLDYF